MIALELNASTLGFLTFVVMFGATVVGYLSLRKHVRGITLPPVEEGSDEAAPAVEPDPR